MHTFIKKSISFSLTYNSIFVFVRFKPSLKIPLEYKN